MQICEKSDGEIEKKLTMKVVENVFSTFLLKIELLCREFSHEAPLQLIQCTWFCAL